MPRAALPSGIELEYVTIGDPSDTPLLVVNGYTSQLISWPQGYVDRLVAQGLYVIRFDNRDVGLSTKLDGQRASPGAVLSASLRGDPLPPVPYTLSDMAADAIGLLDHLGIEGAHIVGNSMGGMIVQTMAIEHPDRIASVTSGDGDGEGLHDVAAIGRDVSRETHVAVVVADHVEAESSKCLAVLRLVADGLGAQTVHQQQRRVRGVTEGLVVDVDPVGFGRWHARSVPAA